MSFSLLIIAVVTIAAIAWLAGLALSVVANRVPGSDAEIVERVNDILPQTQCAQCGYPGCRPYAIAVAEGSAAINLCPPGGDTTVKKLAEMLGRSVLPLGEQTRPSVAVIDESACIGCKHCISACPVDAIVGAPQRMHTVIASECTGCELCIEPCPVDCISLRAVS